MSELINFFSIFNVNLLFIVNWLFYFYDFFNWNLLNNNFFFLDWHLLDHNLFFNLLNWHLHWLQNDFLSFLNLLDGNLLYSDLFFLNGHLLVNNLVFNWHHLLDGLVFLNRHLNWDCDLFNMWFSSYNSLFFRIFKNRLFHFY